MSVDSAAAISGSGFDRRRVRDLLTGSVTSIAVALLIVVIVGLTWVGPKFLSASNLTIIGTFVSVPMLVADVCEIAMPLYFFRYS